MASGIEENSPVFRGRLRDGDACSRLHRFDRGSVKVLHRKVEVICFGTPFAGHVGALWSSTLRAASHTQSLRTMTVFSLGRHLATEHPRPELPSFSGSSQSKRDAPASGNRHAWRAPRRSEALLPWARHRLHIARPRDRHLIRRTERSERECPTSTGNKSAGFIRERLGVRTIASSVSIAGGDANPSITLTASGDRIWPRKSELEPRTVRHSMITKSRATSRRNRRRGPSV